MFIQISTILLVVALLAVGWWLFQSSAAARRQREAEHRDIGRHDHARVFEMAKVQSEASKWRGWF
jgi:hypothetical protein